MARIISIGTRLEFADFADWDEQANIMDYDLVFVNLRDLERRKDEFLHARVPAEYVRQYEFPPVENIINLLFSGGDVFLGLPYDLEAMPSEDQDWEPPEPIPPDTPVQGGTPILNFLSWLPFNIEVREEGGESVEEETIHEDWDWYFEDNFSWNYSFPNQSDVVDSVLFRVRPLVENRYGDCIGAEVSVDRKRGKQTVGVQPDWGTIYLLPLLDGWSMDDLTYGIMDNLYPDVDIETVGRRPDWLSEYSAPREDEIMEEIETLERKLAEVRSFKALLWEDGDELQAAVYNVFRMAGLDVREEAEGRRDGAIHLDDRVLVLEITGTENNLGEGKPSQLNKWVVNNQDEFDEDVSGLFILNYSKNENPGDRRLQTNPDLIETLENLGIKVVTTLELFKMVHGLEHEEIDGDRVAENIRSEGLFVQFDGVDAPF